MQSIFFFSHELVVFYLKHQKGVVFKTTCTYTSGVAIPFLGIEFSKGNILKLFSFAAHCSAAVSVAISARGILFLD
jgi:hypothetical protein